MGALAQDLIGRVTASLTAQADEHAAKMHARAVEIRERDPMAIMLLQTFDRQVRDRARRAGEASAAGDHKAALALARSAEVAAINAATVRTAVQGE